MKSMGALGLTLVCLAAGILFDSPRWSKPPIALASERLSADFRANPLLNGFRPIGQSDGWDPGRRQLIVTREGWNSAPFTVFPGECLQLFVECPDERDSGAAVQASRLTYALTGYLSPGAMEVIAESGEFIAGDSHRWHSEAIRLPQTADSAGSRWTLEVTLRSGGDLPVRVDRMNVTVSPITQALDRR